LIHSNLFFRQHLPSLLQASMRHSITNPRLSEVLREHWTELRAAERKWRKSKVTSDLSRNQSLLSAFSTDAAKSSYFHNKINASNTRSLFKMFNTLLCPPQPPPTSSLTADDFANFVTNKTTTISSQLVVGVKYSSTS